MWHSALHAHLVRDGLIECGFELRQQIVWAKQVHALGRGHYQRAKCRSVQPLNLMNRRRRAVCRPIRWFQLAAEVSLNLTAGPRLLLRATSTGAAGGRRRRARHGARRDRRTRRIYVPNEHHGYAFVVGWIPFASAPMCGWSPR